MLEGEWLRRARLCLKRTLSPLYDDPSLFSASPDWPGDFPGRTLLSLTSLYGFFPEASEERKAILDRLAKLKSPWADHLNEDGYFGPRFDPNSISEQQLSGNSWYLRGLCRYQEIFRDEESKKAISSIISSLLLPLAPYFQGYPISGRKGDGGVSGRIESSGSGWLLSSDIGCAYILLDGYVAAYEVLPSLELKKAIEMVIFSYARIDPAKFKCQTHATLSAARAILRFSVATGEKKYFGMAKRLYDLYWERGSTLDYQNKNWFGRDDSWTEPCCVIDSLLLAKQFYLLTKEESYLVLLNRIAVNGFRTFQRSNGGAGCSSLLLRPGDVLQEKIYEAYFCCTLRQGEGLYEIGRTVEREGSRYTFLLPCSYRDDLLSVSADLYQGSEIEIESKGSFSLNLYVPDGFASPYPAEGRFLRAKGDGPTHLVIPFSLPTREEKGRHFEGDLLLTKKNGEEEYTPLADCSFLSEEKATSLRQTL